MVKFSIRSVTLLIVAFMLVIGGIGCTKYASEEDLQNLEMQKQAAVSAEKKEKAVQKEKAEIERQKATWESKVKAAEDEKAAVEARYNEKQNSEGGE